MIEIWQCSPSWDAWIADMVRLQALALADQEIQRDLDHETLLAREHVAGDSMPWPWYADALVEVCEPEVLPLGLGVAA